jgi:DAK2 domain fusion protein YloV
MTYGYCTEFLLQLQNAKVNIDEFDVEPLKSFLSEIGDSIVAFKTESIVKVHVHTKQPERVLEYARRFGEFITIKIENMSVQHSAGEVEKSQNEEKKEPVTEKKKYGVGAVSNGEGISNVFREFGVDQIVEGGQTNNPSTGEFLEAFEKINAEHIFVLPNNGNIIMAAEQSAEIYDKAKVHVIPAKNIGAGYVAVSTMDLESETPEMIKEAMLEAIANITTGYVSPSIRDAEISGVRIKNGDTIGIIGKEIVISKKDRKKAVLGLLEKLVENPPKYMLTVFFGKDSTEKERADLTSAIAEKYPSLEAYFIDGGQEIAPYIFVAE